MTINFNILGLLTVILVSAKVFVGYEISWFWALSPMIFGLATVLFIMFLVLVFILVSAALGR